MQHAKGGRVFYRNLYNVKLHNKGKGKLITFTKKRKQRKTIEGSILLKKIQKKRKILLTEINIDDNIFLALQKRRIS
jgi:hypothetical protein